MAVVSINKLPGAARSAGEEGAEAGTPSVPGAGQAYDRRVLVPAILRIRERSLVRGLVVVGVSLLLSLRLADFPANRANSLLIVPFVAAAAGTLDTARNMRRRWGWYHGGVVLLLYTELMVLSMIAFFWLYPYASGWFLSTH